MARLVDASAGSGDIPPGMQYYSFMFGEQQADVPEHVAAGNIPLPSSLFVGLGVGAALTVLRMLLDFAFFKPLARKILGFPHRQLPRPVGALDVLCSKSKPKILSADEVAAASASTGLSSEEVREYIKVRRVSALESAKLGKFKEAAWRLVVYVWLVAFALKKSYGESWFRDPFLVWDNWPGGNHGEGLELYYHCAMGVYWHMIIFQFLEAKRSDFYQMLVHHVATLFLLTFSWLTSLVRIGLLIMLCHDVSDVFLESAKLFNYAQKRFHWCHLAADVIFFAFAAVFGVSRLYVFPRYLILNVWSTPALSKVPTLVYCGLLTTLLVLHVFWFYLILRMVYMFVFHGVEEDIRSDNEEEGEDANSIDTASGHPQNGHSKAARNGKSPARGSSSKGKSKMT